jgi:hypothetical protein
MNAGLFARVDEEGLTAQRRLPARTPCGQRAQKGENATPYVFPFYAFFAFTPVPFFSHTAGLSGPITTAGMTVWNTDR